MGIILDNGCKRNVGGSKWHREVQAMLKTKGLCGRKIDVHEEFLFGSDRVDTSLCAWEYPVGIHGHTGVINIAEIESNCPGLMSADTMKKLDISINTGPDTYHIHAFGVEHFKHEWSDTGHALLRIDWFGDLSTLNPKFFLENLESNTVIKKGTAKRLRAAVRVVSDVNVTSDSEASTSVPSDVEQSGAETVDDDDWDGYTCVAGLPAKAREKLSVMEVNINHETGSILQSATERGWVGLPAISVGTGFDLRTKDGIQRAWKHLFSFKPDVICLRLPGKPWEPGGVVDDPRKYRAYRRSVRFCADLLHWQHARDACFFAEAYSKSPTWQLSDFSWVLTHP